MGFRYALCSEVYKLPIEQTIRRVAEIGYEGIEIAPFCVAEDIEDVPAARRAEIAKVARDEGVEVVGLHWLLVSPKGLHLATVDESVRRRTIAYLKSLVRFAADIGGKVLVLGSPKQRQVPPGEDPREAMRRVAEALRSVAEVCEERDAWLLVEPLGPAETNFLNTVEEALALIRLAGHPRVAYHIDVKAASTMPDGIVGTIKKYGRGARHFHANEPGGLAPGMGRLDFRPILAALRDSGYAGWVSVEPFSYEPDPDTVARTALKALREAD